VSYTGTGVIGSPVAYEAVGPEDTGLVASRDIIRRNAIGQTVVVVPAGQPIPAGLELEDGDAIPSPPPQIPHVEYHHRPEPIVTALERHTLYSERALTLLRRRPWR
jgi:hypothetical protein